MICEHCGTQNSDNTRICTHCGMPIGRSDGRNAVKKEDTEVKTSKNVMKRKSLLLIIGIPLVGYLIGQMAGEKIGKSMSEDLDSTSSIEENVNTSLTEDREKNTETENPEYTKIFTERNIIKLPLFTIEESAYFVKVDVDEEGGEMIDCIDFSYDGDTGIISTMTETVYQDIKSLNEEEVQAMDAENLAKFQEEYADVDNFTVSSEVGNQYYRVTFEYKNLDDEKVVETFEERGLLTTDREAGLLGIVPTETSLLDQGYVKK